MEGREEAKPGPVVRIGRMVRSATARFVKDLEPEHLEVNEKNFAGEIKRLRFNPQSPVKRSGMPFTLAEIMWGLGYVHPQGDFWEKYKEQYTHGRQILQDFTNRNLLEMSALDEPDLNGERLEYVAIDEKQLSRIARLSKNS